jgi:hypothetical protein
VMDEPVGVALDRNIASSARGNDAADGEWVEKELDHFIAKRHKQRVKEEGERPEEEAWVESERRENARRREQNRLAWYEFHTMRATSLRADLEALIAHHEGRAEKLRGEAI